VNTRWLARVMLNGGLKLVCGRVTARSSLGIIRP
jgi:hypothetical protein